MAFKFQINSDVKFKHEEHLLKKAEENIPKIKYKEEYPVNIVELEEDSEKLMGFGMKLSDKKIEDLSSYGWKRDEAFILDFGNHCVGHFSIEIDQVGSPMDAPLFLRLRFAEVPAELASDTLSYDGWLSKSWIQEEYVHLDELPLKLELSRRYSFRYIEIKVMDTSPKWQAVFHHPVVRTETTADYEKLKSSKVADKELQKICEVSIKTLADCMQNVFEDGPKRDRRLWLGDLRLQALANYATFDNKELVKRCLYLFAAMTTEQGKIPANVFVKPKNIPDDTFLFDYSLFFISSLYDYLKEHPEKEVLDDLYPICKTQIDLSLGYVNEQGRLIEDESYPVFIDWSNEFDKTTAGQAILIYALKQFLELAKWKKDVEYDKYKKIMERMICYSKKELFDTKRMLFLSGEKKEYNIASQVWMVLSKIMSDEENYEIMKRTIEELFPVRGIATPYMYHHVTEALFAAGLKTEAITLMKDYWGKMIEMGADTYWEAFDPQFPDYSPYGDPIVSSYCHAWGCTPIYLVKKYL